MNDQKSGVNIIIAIVEPSVVSSFWVHFTAANVFIGQRSEKVKHLDSTVPRNFIIVSLN